MKRLVAIVLPFALASFACAHDVVLPDLVTDSACGDGVVEPGEACDTTSDGCVQCEITPGWNCDGNQCHLECGDGLVSTDSACTNPKRDTDCDMTGYWAVRETDFERDAVLQSVQVSSNWYLYHLTQSGDDFTVDQMLDCGIHVTGSVTVEYTAASLRAVIYGNRMDDASGPHGARHGTSKKTDAGCTMTLDRWYAVRGAEDSYLPADFSAGTALADLPPIPTEADPVNGTDTPAGSTDPDGDGIPGLSFAITGFVTGTRNSAQRTTKDYTTGSNVVPAAAVELSVPGTFDLQENVLRVTDCGGSCGLMASSAHAAQDIQDRITFSFVGKTFGSPRVASIVAGVPRAGIDDDLTTCANVRRVLPHDATLPPGAK
ncbi:MAG TPA: hypothetical protein VF407_18850 [Polyangiaceae bacterium]